jgi:hypothetical protein
MVPIDLGSFEFWQFFITQTSTIWGVIGFVRQFSSLPQHVGYGSGWISSETHQFMSFRAAVLSIFTLAGSVIVAVIVDWPVIAGWIPWTQIAGVQAGPLLNFSAWLYSLLFSVISSAYKTAVAIISAGVASVLNLLR